GAVEAEFTERRVNIKANGGNANQAEDGGLAHDDFPAIQQQRQEVAVQAWQQLVEIARDTRRAVGTQAHGIAEAAEQVGDDATGVQAQRDNAGQHRRTKQQQQDKGEQEFRRAAQYHEDTVTETALHGREKMARDQRIQQQRQ